MRLHIDASRDVVQVFAGTGSLGTGLLGHPAMLRAQRRDRGFVPDMALCGLLAPDVGCSGCFMESHRARRCGQAQR